MPWSDDPHADFDRYDTEQTRWLESRPKCSIYGEHIQEDHYYRIKDKRICPVCLEENFKVEING